MFVKTRVNCSSFILPKKYAQRETYDKPKPTNTFSPNRYQLLEPTSENIELVSENIHRNRKFTEFKKKNRI